MRKIWIIAALLLVTSAVFAQSGLSNVQSAIGNFCADLKSLLPVAAMLMVVVAGVIYAAGQIMGAETRARANVWATSALVGALIGLLIYAIAPPILGMIYSGGGSLQSGTVCA
jgi:uncharacterized membrane protein